MVGGVTLELGAGQVAGVSAGDVGSEKFPDVCAVNELEPDFTVMAPEAALNLITLAPLVASAEVVCREYV